MALAMSVHLLAAVFWIGGMWMMLTVVRPAAVALLPPPQRIPLLRQVLGRFFTGVWVALVVLWLSGGWLLPALGGMAAQAWPIHAMIGLALVMTLVFALIYFLPFRRLKTLVVEERWPDAGTKLEQIRKLVWLNALLGLLLLLAVSGGRYI